MKTICHIFLCVTFIIVAMNVAIIDSALSHKQMLTAGELMRDTCQPKFDLNNEIIDAIKLGQFPENAELMCYVNCILELMTIIRQGVPNYDLTVKQMNKLLPVELREDYINGVNACRNAGNNSLNQEKPEKTYPRIQI